MNIPLSEGFDVSNLSAQFLQVVQQEQAEKQAQANKAPVKVRNVTGENAGIIGKVNEISTVEALRLCGKYTEQNDGSWLFNGSTSGVPGGRITDNGKFYTFHESDRLLCDGHSHDAFDIFVAHWFNGDFSKAVEQAAKDFDPEGQKQRRLEHVKNQSILTPSPNPETASQAKFGSLLVDGNELKAKRAKIDWNIHGIIEADTTGGIFGPSGEGKTFISDDLMFCVVTGLPWNGHAVKKGLVLSCVGEGFSGKPRRLQASVVKYGDFDLSGLLISKSTLNFETDIQRIVDEVRAVINMKGLSLVLIVIDTFARHLMCGDENSAKDVMKFLKLVESLRSNFSGCSVLIITHTGNDSENLHRARGCYVPR